MNNPVSQVTSAAKRIFAGGYTQERNNALQPRRDWYIGIGVGCLIALGIAGWSAYIYIDNRNNTINDVEVETTAPVYKAALIQEAQQIVADRASAFDAVMQPMAVAQPQETPPSLVATSTVTTEPTSTSTASDVVQPPAQSDAIATQEVSIGQESEVDGVADQPSSDIDQNPDEPDELVVPELSQ